MPTQNISAYRTHVLTAEPFRSGSAQTPTAHPATKKATIVRLPFRAFQVEVSAPAAPVSPGAPETPGAGSEAASPTPAAAFRRSIHRHSPHAARILPATEKAKSTKAVAPNVASPPDHRRIGAGLQVPAETAAPK